MNNKETYDVTVKFTMAEGCYLTEKDEKKMVDFVVNSIKRASSLLNCPDCLYPSRLEPDMRISGTLGKDSKTKDN